MSSGPEVEHDVEVEHAVVRDVEDEHLVDVLEAEHDVKVEHVALDDHVLDADGDLTGAIPIDGEHKRRRSFG